MAEEPKKQSWLMWVLSPGIGSGVITFTRICLLACVLYLWAQVIFMYNIHYLIMSILSVCLFGSFEFFISELKKNPEFMSGKPPEKKD